VLFGCRLLDVTFGRLGIAVRCGLLAMISCSVPPPGLLISDGLSQVALRRVPVASGGGVLASIGSLVTQPRFQVSGGLAAVALSRGRLSPLRRALSVSRGMITTPPALIELRRLWIRFGAYIACGVSRCSIVAAVA
jgi:hypothetical protein